MHPQNIIKNLFNKIMFGKLGKFATTATLAGTLIGTQSCQNQPNTYVDYGTIYSQENTSTDWSYYIPESKPMPILIRPNAKQSKESTVKMWINFKFAEDRWVDLQKSPRDEFDYLGLYKYRLTNMIFINKLSDLSKEQIDAIYATGFDNVKVGVGSYTRMTIWTFSKKRLAENDVQVEKIQNYLFDYQCYCNEKHLHDIVCPICQIGDSCDNCKECGEIEPPKHLCGYIYPF